MSPTGTPGDGSEERTGSMIHIIVCAGASRSECHVCSAVAFIPTWRAERFAVPSRCGHRALGSFFWGGSPPIDSMIPPQQLQGLREHGTQTRRWLHVPCLPSTRGLFRFHRAFCSHGAGASSPPKRRCTSCFRSVACRERLRAAIVPEARQGLAPNTVEFWTGCSSGALIHVVRPSRGYRSTRVEAAAA